MVILRTIRSNNRKMHLMPQWPRQGFRGIFQRRQFDRIGVLTKQQFVQTTRECVRGATRAAKTVKIPISMVNPSIAVLRAPTALHEVVLFSPLHPLSVINRFINRRRAETPNVLADDFFDLIT